MSGPGRARPSNSVSGWMLVLIGIGILVVWAIILLVIAAAGLPIESGRHSRGLFLLVMPLAGLAVVVAGLVSVIRRKPLQLTSSPGSGRYGSLGPKIRAAERDARIQRRRLRAERRRSRP